MTYVCESYCPQANHSQSAIGQWDWGFQTVQAGIDPGTIVAVSAFRWSCRRIDGSLDPLTPANQK